MTRAFVDPDEVAAPASPAPKKAGGFIDPDAPKAAAAAAPVDPWQALRDRAKQAALGAVAPHEAAAAIGSGAVGSIAGGLAGLAQGAKNLVFPGMPAGDRVRQVQEAVQYQPRGEVGQAMTNVISYLPEQLAKGADYVGGKVSDVVSPILGSTVGPAVGAAYNTAIQAGPQLLATALKAPVRRMAGRADVEATTNASRNSVRDSTLVAAREEGYVVPPSEANRGGTALGNRVEGVAGKAALNQESQLRNQEVTNKIARREAGLADDAPLTEKELSAARDSMSAPYKEVAALNPMAANALEKLKQTRAEAKLKYNEYNRQQTVNSLREAEALEAKAELYEVAIDKIANRIGNPGLVDRLKEARTNLAKNYDVERALNVGSGDVDAMVIARQFDKRGEKGMTGGLATIGRFANAFPRQARQGGPLPTPGKGEGLSAAMLGMAGHAGGLGWYPAGAALLGGPARSLALSNMMQRPRTYGPGAAGMLSTLTQYPNAYAVSPALGGILSQLQEQ